MPTAADLARFPELNPGPVARMDRDGAILQANTAARAFFGADALVGARWLTLCPDLAPDAWQRVLAGEADVRCEVECAGRCVMFTHVLSVPDDAVFAFGADITERRRAERLADAQARELAELARFPDMNPGPVLRLDLSGRVLLANAAARAVLGDDLLGRAWLEITPTVSPARWSEIIAAREVVRIEVRIGDCDYVLAHRRDHHGALVFVYGADVTAQRRAERALRQSEKMATLGTLAAGVTHELNNPAAAARRAAEQLRDAIAARESALQALDAHGIPAEARAVLHELDATARSLATQGAEMGSLAVSDLEDECEQWLLAHGIADAWERAPSLVAQGLTCDALDRLAERIAGPTLDAALRWLATGYPVHRLVHEIGTAAGRISEIVGALKGYSYLGQAPVQAVDIRAGLDDTLVILRSRIHDGVTVRRQYAPDLPRIPVYGSELNQVWTNLLVNAVDALGSTGSITIDVRAEPEWMRVAIEDDGPGIPAEIRERIFDPFFTTKEPGEGTGLGLATCYSIVAERHGGRIEVESRPGRTCFIVRLPLEGAPVANLPHPR